MDNVQNMQLDTDREPFCFGEFASLPSLREMGYRKLIEYYLPPASAFEVIESVPSVCLCVRLSSLSRLNRLMYGQEILHVGQPGPYLGQV